MATKRIIPDNDFGEITIRTYRLARNITMRTKPDGLYVTVPPHFRTNKILSVIENYREKLLEKWERIQPQPLDLSFSIEAPCFRLKLEQGKWKCFTIRNSNDEIVIYCPPNIDFTNESIQKLLKAAIKRAIKRRAEEYLPQVLKTWADRYQLFYKQVKISQSRSRWGSCSTTKRINLSCYLMLLPPHLMDYVILHELAHLKEMNHSTNFWDLLNNMIDGQAKQLRKELREFKLPLL